MSDPHAELRERMAAALYRLEWNADLYATPRGGETVRYERRADRLIAAGFGDVAAERARADTYSRLYTEAEAAHDRLWSLIQSAPHGNGNGHVCPATFTPLQSRLAGHPPCNCWKSAALTEPTPAPEPGHPNPECDYNKTFFGYLNTDCTCYDPEPVKLDPLPWLNRHAGTRQSHNRDRWREFAPRPEYSQNREDYSE